MDLESLNKLFSCFEILYLTTRSIPLADSDSIIHPGKNGEFLSAYFKKYISTIFNFPNELCFSQNNSPPFE